MKIQEELIGRREELRALCEKHKVQFLYAFGSSVTGNFKLDSSDIDLLVKIDEINPLKRGVLLISFWDELEVFFQRKVDLLTESSIKNPYLRDSINETKVLIYGSREKVLV